MAPYGIVVFFNNNFIKEKERNKMIYTMIEMVDKLFDEIITPEKAKEFWDYTSYEECTMKDVEEIYYMVM